MTADIDPAFSSRCKATAIGLRQLVELGERPGDDDGALELAARVTAELLADPEALLAVALTIEQQRAGEPWFPAIGDLIETVKPGTHDGERGEIVRFQAARLPYVVRWPAGYETGYAAHEIRKVPR